MFMVSIHCAWWRKLTTPCMTSPLPQSKKWVTLVTRKHIRNTTHLVSPAPPFETIIPCQDRQNIFHLNLRNTVKEGRIKVNLFCQKHSKSCIKLAYSRASSFKVEDTSSQRREYFCKFRNWEEDLYDTLGTDGATFKQFPSSLMNLK